MIERVTVRDLREQQERIEDLERVLVYKQFNEYLKDEQTVSEALAFERSQLRHMQRAYMEQASQ